MGFISAERPYKATGIIARVRGGDQFTNRLGIDIEGVRIKVGEDRDGILVNDHKCRSGCRQWWDNDFISRTDTCRYQA